METTENLFLSNQLKKMLANRTRTLLSKCFIKSSEGMRISGLSTRFFLGSGFALKHSKSFSSNLYFRHEHGPNCNHEHHNCDHSEEGMKQSNQSDELTEAERRQKTEKMGMFYTCGSCKQRHYIEFSKHSYHKGVVISRCKNCQKLHLIADHLGWIGDKKSLEDTWGKIVKQSDFVKKDSFIATVDSSEN